jgi:hypothetical protein
MPFVKCNNLKYTYTVYWSPENISSKYFITPAFHCNPKSESLFAASQTLSIQDSLTPELNKVPCLSFKFKSGGLLLWKHHGTQVSKQALTHTTTQTCKERLFSVTRFENRIEGALIFNFTGKSFFIFPSLKIPNMNTSMFKNMWLGHWHLPHRCLVFWVCFFQHILEYYSPHNILTIKYLFMKNALKTKTTNWKGTSLSPVHS